MELFSIIIDELFEGFGNTLLLFAVTLVFALVLGLLLSFGAMSKLKRRHQFILTMHGSKAILTRAKQLFALLLAVLKINLKEHRFILALR